MQHTTESVWQIFCCKLQPYIRKWVSDPEIAKDIEQDVFLRIHEKIDTLKDDTKIHSWVLQITKNIIFDCFRKHKEKFRDIDKLDFSDNVEFDVFTDKNERDPENELSEGLRTLVDSLPPKYSKALVLVEFEGISQVELAKRLKLSPSAAKSRVQRGRQMVKERLINCCHYEFDIYGNVIGIRPKSCHVCNP